jgi:serine/threonine-protein kinase
VTGAPTKTDSREPPPAAQLLTAGSSFARYEIVRCIGVGGMGAVFEATHTLLRKRVALKTLHETLGRSEASRARFLREAETVARIRHDHVVDISDVGIERGIPFLVMEFLEGEDLASLLEREGRLSAQRAVDLLLPAVAGLCAVHRLGIVHRDIKPENIFLAMDSLGSIEPKLVDFGVSKDLEASGSSDGVPLRHTVAGTPYYMAPEQARGSAVLDGRADQYALGVVLYQCLSLVRPFESASLLELIHLIDAGQYTPLAERCPELPPELCAIVQRAMACRVAERFASSEAFGQALAPFASEQVAAACARDFAVERRSALPRAWSSEALERLSAPTMPEAPRAIAPQAPRAPTSGSLSGVRARDTDAPTKASTSKARSRRAFVLSAFVTLVLLLTGALYGLLVRVPASGPVTRHSDAPRAVGREPAAPAAPAPAPAASAPSAPGAAPTAAPAPSAPSPTSVPAAAVRADPQRSPRPAKPKSEPQQPPPVDIQLSR